MAQGQLGMKAPFEKLLINTFDIRKSKSTKNLVHCDDMPKPRRANLIEINVRLLPMKD